MRRILLEWGMMAAIGAALSLSALWVATADPRSAFHLKIPTTWDGREGVHLLIGEGAFTLCDHFENDASGFIRPFIIDHTLMSPAEIRQGNRVLRISAPGVDYRFFRHGPHQWVIRSLRLSMLYAILPATLVGFFLGYRLHRLRARSSDRHNRALGRGRRG